MWGESNWIFIFIDVSKTTKNLRISEFSSSFQGFIATPVMHYNMLFNLENIPSVKYSDKLLIMSLVLFIIKEFGNFWWSAILYFLVFKELYLRVVFCIEKLKWN